MTKYPNFEWYKKKREKVLKDRGLDFIDAVKLFDQ